MDMQSGQKAHPETALLPGILSSIEAQTWRRDRYLAEIREARALLRERPEDPNARFAASFNAKSCRLELRFIRPSLNRLRAMRRAIEGGC